MILVDHREGTAGEEIGFIVWMDTFMSGWGPAKDGKSFYALAFRTTKELQVLQANGKHRGEMERPQVFLSLEGLSKVGGPKDHLTIGDWNRASRWYEEGAFK